VTKQTQTQILALIKQLAEDNSDVDVVWLYGSRAQGTYVEGSDFDLAIAFKNFDLSPTDALLRPNELVMDWALTLGINEDKLSIVDINRCPVYLAFNVVEFGHVMFETGTMRVYKEKNRIYSQYEFQMIEND